MSAYHLPPWLVSRLFFQKELEQMAVNGLLNLSNTKEANKNPSSETVAQGAKMKILIRNVLKCLIRVSGKEQKPE
jgi:hypothetical protein